MLDHFIEELNKFVPLENTDLLKEISDKVSIQNKPKGSILLNEGEYSARVLFLIEGLARGFYYHEGNEITSWVIQENNFLFSPSNFFSDKPANESIQLIENSKLLIMSKKDLLDMQLRYPEAALLTIKVLEKFLIYYDTRVRFLRLSAEERLIMYDKEYPNVSKRLSISQLSSFLGLSKSSISHIRTKK